ncbi:hypothetical protein [Streptomyces sp. NPDC088789]|uniref:hypothetical protein n=1 Tax=Streptomyces sp. NPDC088789 TaxID=3365899 RepID=UPI0037F267B5
MKEQRETWTTDEFGASHEGSVGVLAADGNVPKAVYFDIESGPTVHSSTHWSIYDGCHGAPQAAALRGVCACAWTGPEYPLSWNGEEDLEEAGAATADQCMRDWEAHTAEVAEAAIPLPTAVTMLLEQVRDEIERLSESSPLAALRAARNLEITSADLGYWAALSAHDEADDEQVATALGLSEQEARALVARYGRRSPYL